MAIVVIGIWQITDKAIRPILDGFQIFIKLHRFANFDQTFLGLGFGFLRFGRGENFAIIDLQQRTVLSFTTTPNSVPRSSKLAVGVSKRNFFPCSLIRTKIRPARK